MRIQIRRMGNSSGIIIPKPILDQIGIAAGDDVELCHDDNRILLTPARPARAGWADAAKRIAESGDVALVWPEFGNADVANLEW
jgi:antitoxin MazE